MELTGIETPLSSHPHSLHLPKHTHTHNNNNNNNKPTNKKRSTVNNNNNKTNKQQQQNKQKTSNNPQTNIKQIKNKKKKEINKCKQLLENTVAYGTYSLITQAVPDIYFDLYIQPADESAHNAPFPSTQLILR